MGRFIVPFGILTYVFLIAALITGVARAKLRYHKRLAYAAIVFATIHAALILIVG